MSWLRQRLAFFLYHFLLPVSHWPVVLTLALFVMPALLEAGSAGGGNGFGFCIMCGCSFYNHVFPFPVGCSWLVPFTVDCGWHIGTECIYMGGASD